MMSLGWKIEDDTKAMIMERLQDLISNDPNSRSAVRAIECITKMEEQNIRIAEASSVKTSVRFTAPYEQMSASQNESIVDGLVSGAIEPPDLAIEEDPSL